MEQMRQNSQVFCDTDFQSTKMLVSCGLFFFFSWTTNNNKNPTKTTNSQTRLVRLC